jgi:hypothetical protein
MDWFMEPRPFGTKLVVRWRQVALKERERKGMAEEFGDCK